MKSFFSESSLLTGFSSDPSVIAIGIGVCEAAMCGYMVTNNLKTITDFRTHVLDGYLVSRVKSDKLSPNTWYIAMRTNIPDNTAPFFVYSDSNLETHVVVGQLSARFAHVHFTQSRMEYYKIKDGIIPPLHKSLLNTP